MEVQEETFVLYFTSRIPASTVESLSNFFTKKPAHADIPPQIEESPIKNIREPTEDINFEFEDSDSPYKNLIKTDTKIILNDSASDAADFRSPVPIRKTKNSKFKLGTRHVQKSKSKRKTPIKKVRGSSKRTIRKNSTTKFITDNFKQFGENPEHIQLAMALSKSTYEAECGSSCPSPPKEEILNISEILRNSKPAFLERFGFTSGKSVLPVETRKVTTTVEATKRTKNRFKYITPILNIRTDEERTSLISSKISLILCQKNQDLTKSCELSVSSNRLKNCISKGRSIFNLDDIYEKNNFYVKNLDIPHNRYQCGHLLKDWRSIPGRDKSPCKTIKNVAIGAKPGYQVQDTEYVRNYNESTEIDKRTAKETTFSEVTAKRKSVNKETSCKILPLKHHHETLSLEANPSFSVPTKTRKPIFGSFNSESKDSGITDSFASSSKLSVPSFSSSCRSLSPDLFGSDDETDQQPFNKSDNIVPKSLLSPKKCTETVRELFSLNNSNTTEENMHDTNENSTEKLGDCSNGDQGKHKNYISLEKQEVSSASPSEIIDLTGDVGDTETNIEQTKQSCDKRNVNIYNLDEFELDNNCKMVLSPDNKEHITDLTVNRRDDSCLNRNHVDDTNNLSKNNLAKYRNDGPDDFKDDELSPDNKAHITDLTGNRRDDSCLNRNHVDDTNNLSKNNLAKYRNDGPDDFKDDQKTLNATITENYNIKRSAGHVGLASAGMTDVNNSSFNNIEIVNDNDKHYDFENIDKSNSPGNSFNNCNKENSLGSSSIGSETETCDNAHKIDDCLSDYHSDDSSDLNDFNKQEADFKSDGSLNDTPKRNKYFYDEIEIFSNKNDTCSNKSDVIPQRSFDSVKNKNLALEGTPKRCVENKNVKSPCFDEPLFYDSTNLNVTDYVNNMLSQENFSFDRIKHVDVDEEEGRQIVNNDEEMPSSKGSQSSVILNEELNYSGHFSTPLRVRDEAANEINDEFDKDATSVFPGPEQNICLDTPHSENCADVNSEIAPQTTLVKQISTPNNYIIKTDNVTPMPDYDKMATPSINMELQKVGVKPLKRTRGAKLLKFIYESTHPYVGPKDNILPDNLESDEDKRVIKKRKQISEGLSLTNSSDSSDAICLSSIEIMGDKIIENEKTEDLVFERRQSAKIPSCKVPLQIVWHNLVSSHPAIKENILLYEPLQLKSLHMMLKEQGFKYRIQDLLTFLDKKCISVRTAQNKGNHTGDA